MTDPDQPSAPPSAEPSPPTSPTPSNGGGMDGSVTSTVGSAPELPLPTAGPTQGIGAPTAPAPAAARRAGCLGTSAAILLALAGAAGYAAHLAATWLS